MEFNLGKARAKNRAWAAVRASVVAEASQEAESQTERRRVTIAGAKGRRKLDTREKE